MMKTTADVKQAGHCLFSIPHDDTYQLEYPYFVDFFANKSNIGLPELIVGSNMVYGWMPTILKIKSTNFEPALKALNKAKGGEVLTDEDFKAIVAVVNNSLVGTSKLLHFVNPTIYPIWDSRVSLWLLGSKSSSQLNSIPNYRSYMSLCEQLTRDDEFLKLTSQFEQHIGYAVTPVRVAELIMFTSGRV
ncbi:hypothetical protein [Vibrio splendidus]|uniref:hypothetical protein n=2 Tax=Vibrio splendidus TaxID=29497 RepID=UPI001ABFB9FC|nr:hypothetical protein [Vibrio splendidus]